MLHRGRRNLGKRARRQEIEETRARNAFGRLLIWTDLYPCQPINLKPSARTVWPQVGCRGWDPGATDTSGWLKTGTGVYRLVSIFRPSKLQITKSAG
jgi:hypothetical protein